MTTTRRTTPAAKKTAAPRKTATAKQQQAESLKAGFSVTFRGEKFSFPPAAEWPIEAFEAAEVNNIVTFVREIFADQDGEYDRAKKACKNMGGLGEFFDAVMGAMSGE